MAKKDNATAATEESSVYEYILSTCCGGNSSPGVKSVAKRIASTKHQQQEQPQPPPPPPQQEQEQDHDHFEKPKFLDRLINVALYLIGGAPPVNFVKCFQCPSVDRSELTLPPVLSSLADEYDKNNRSQVDSMWSISEDVTEGTPVINSDVSPSTGTGNLIQKNRFSDVRRKNIKLKTSRSDSSYFSWRNRKNPKREKNSLIKTIIRGNWSRRSQSSRKSRASHHSNSNMLQCDEL